MNLERALATEGWMSPNELEYLAQAASKSLYIAEIGCWKGRSTIALAENTTGIVFAIDTWKGSIEHQGELSEHHEGWLFSEFSRNTDGIENIWPVPMNSLRARRMMVEIGMQFDMVFIDASHDYENVSADIKAWSPLLSKTGILCGHDFTGDYPGIAQAVKELVPRYRTIGSIWTTEV